ncbi:MAG: hypothetical protein ACE5G8_16370, partial [Anaerolineae bacterium]
MKQHLLALFLFLFALYLLTYSPTLHSSDGLTMFSTAESLARRGAWDVEQIRWMGLQQGTYGLDGRLYSRKGVGQPLLALPFTWLGLVIPWFGTVTTTLLLGSLITALTGGLIFCYLEWLGYRRATALTAGLVYGTGTLAWPYAKTFFSDTLAGTLLLLAAMFLLAHYRRGRRRDAFAAGLALAWAVATRYAEAVFLPLFGLLFAAYLRRRSGGGGPRRAFNPAALAAFAAPIAAVGLSLMAFNLFRYGDPFNTGYLPQETFSAVWWQGVAGQLFSPGRGLFLYSPALIVALFGLKAGWRRRPFETFAALAVIVIHLLLYGKWFMWHGGFAWGPRFMVAALPFWAVLMAPTLEAIAARSLPPLIRRGFFVLWGVSVAAQLPGLAVDFDLWQNRLLQTGLPLFAPETFFRPVYSPLLGTWQFINPANLDLAWAAGGKINWILLAALAANLALAGVALAAAGRKRPARMWLPVAAAAAIATVIFLLTAAHRAQPVPLTRALAEVNRLPDAPLIYNTPEQAIPLAELYAGRAPVLGLIEADA